MSWIMRAARALAVSFLAAGGVAGVAVPSAQAAIPAPPSQWYGLPGLNAASGAQWVRALAYSTPPNVVYAGLEGGGVFRSIDGGANWSAFNGGFANPLTVNVRALLTSSAGTTVYAGTDSGLWRSTGGNWAPVAQGSEADPAQPKKLNASIQVLLSPAGSPSLILAGVLSGGVFKSTDGGETWTPPPVNNGMPASETIYGLTSNVPGVIYATGGSGVYLSTDAGSTWTRRSDGIPGSASPITTWSYPARPNQLFTSTGSNGIYRSLNGGLTWAPINDGLGAVRARGLQILPGSSTQGVHLYAATEDGLWEARQAGSASPAPPRWHEATKNGLIVPGASNTIMWSLTAPVIPGAGSLGLIAGTQSNGGYFVSFQPPDSVCSETAPDNSTDCPRINDTTPQVAQTLSAFNGQWTGTPFLEYAYQWQRCSGTSCTDIADAEETTYTVPESGLGFGYRVEITATNPAPVFGIVRRFSTITSPTASNAAAYPGSTQPSAPSISVNLPGETSSPEVGDTMFAEYGIAPSLSSDGWFNPKATTSIAYRWLRCTASGTDCNEIPGATGRTYMLTAADGTRELRVRVRGVNPSGAAELTSPASYDVISSPATLGDPLPPDQPGGPAKSQAPSLSGQAYVGETLAGNVGGWKDPTTDYLRRWVRCDAAGNACTYLQKVGSTDPENGPTYVVRADDLGSTLRMRVTADVNNDLTPDGLDNHAPNAVEIDTAASAVVTNRPVAGPPGGGGSGGGGGTPGPGGGSAPPADTTAPSVSALAIPKKSFVAGKSNAFSLFASEAGTVRVVITTPSKGRKAGKSCVAETKKNRKKKSCKYQKVVATLTQAAGAGRVTIPFDGRIGTKRKKKLPVGSYTATIVVTDSAGNASKATSITFKIKRR